ncbi:MAG: hypothetical protein ACM3JB_08915 [Acidobacteriaceae bacterium]
MDPEPKAEKLITFSSLHIEVLGPRNLGNNPLANVCVADLLRAAEYELRKLLRERANLFPDLK